MKRVILVDLPTTGLVSAETLAIIHLRLNNDLLRLVQEVPNERLLLRLYVPSALAHILEETARQSLSRL